jgi:hypothetical protein
MSVVLPVFQKFPTEGEIIGRLVVGYGELEIDLCRCIAASGSNLDKVVRNMFGERGEKRRIGAAAKIGHDIFHSLELDKIFDEVIEEMRCCLNIRNMFAHCNFYDDDTGTLSFVNVEELAEQANVIIDDLELAPKKKITLEVLSRYETYFIYVRTRFDFLNCEARVRAGKLAVNPISPPEKLNPPP